MLRHGSCRPICVGARAGARRVALGVVLAIEMICITSRLGAARRAEIKLVRHAARRHAAAALAASPPR